MSQITLTAQGPLVYLSPEGLAILSEYGARQYFTPGEILIHEGAPQECFYIVLSGAVTVMTIVQEREIVLATLQPGDCFGEVAIFQPGPASATVKAASQGEMWLMTSDQLGAFLVEQPMTASALLLGINLILGDRLTHATNAVKAGSVIPTFLRVRARGRSNESQVLPKAGIK